MAYVATFAPRIRFIENNLATGEYVLPLPVDEFRVTWNRDSQQIHIPMVNGGNIYGPSWSLGRISIRGEMQRKDAADIVTEFENMKTACEGSDALDNYVRIYSQYDRAAGVCVWYEQCQIASISLGDMRGTPYRPWVWATYALDFYVGDDTYHYDATYTGAAGTGPAAEGAAAPDASTVVGAMVCYGNLTVKNSSTGLTKIKLDDDGNLQFTGTLSNPTTIS